MTNHSKPQRCHNDDIQHLNYFSSRVTTVIRESYLANLRHLPPDALKIVVTASSRSPLAPSWALIKAWRANPRLLSWQEYQKRYRKEIRDNPAALKLLKKIRAIGERKDVYLICYEKHFPCHRFILRDMIQELST